MALTDINFAIGDNQNFLVERPVGLLFAPLDIETETSSTQYPVLEAPLIVAGAGEGDIFIIND